MGGTSWTYFTPYQPDIEKALQELRERVFYKGAYMFSIGTVSLMGTISLDDEDTPHNVEMARAIREKVETIDKLLELADYSGTHSIIDVRHTASERERYSDSPVVVPALSSDLLKWFGTDKPTRSMVETNEETLFRFISFPRYFIVYKEGLPDEIYFIGKSGD